MDPPNGGHFAFGELLGKAPQVTKGACSWFGPSFVRVPSLRPCSVGPRRTDIHVLTALSPHPCGSTHSARPAFSLHQSRVWRCLDLLRRKDQKQSKADQEQIEGRSVATDLWERACSRRGWYIHQISGVWNTAFASKLAPTERAVLSAKMSVPEPAPSRLKPVLQGHHMSSVGPAPTVGPALAGKLLILIFLRDSSDDTYRDLGAG